MPNNVHNVERFLAAHEGGYAPPFDTMDWLADALREWQRRPNTNLTQALGLGNGAKRLCDFERMKVLRWFYAEYEVVLDKSKYAASQDMADNLQLLVANYDNPDVPPQYRLLYGKLNRIGAELPKQDVIYKVILHKNADFSPNDSG